MGDIDGRAPATSKQAAIGLLAVSIVVMPLGVGALAFMITSLDTGVGGELRIAESLIVKITYSPELAKYIGPWGIASSKVAIGETEYIEEIGGYFRIEWLQSRVQSREEVKILVGNNTVGVFSEDELRGAVKIMNLTVEGLTLKIVAGIWEIPLLDQTSVPSNVRRDALLLLKNQSFVRWLESEGFGYIVVNVEPLPPPEPSLGDPAIGGVVIGLRVESLDVYYHLYFEEPYHLVVNASLPEEFELSPYDKDNYGIYRICISEGTSSTLSQPHPASRSITRPDSPRMSRLNVTDEIREEVLAIMKGDRVLNRLLESAGCEVKRISGWVSENSIHRPEGITAHAILVCEEIEGYGVRVDIDLNTGKIGDVYLYTESTIETILSVYEDG